MFHKLLDPKDPVSIWMAIMVVMTIVIVYILVFFCCCLVGFKCIRYCQRWQRNSKKKKCVRFHPSTQEISTDADFTIHELETKELGNLQCPRRTAASQENISSSENKEATVMAIETARMMVDALNPKINSRSGDKELTDKRVSDSGNEEIPLATFHPCPIHSGASKLGVGPQRSQGGGSPSRVKTLISKFEGKKEMSG